MTIQIGRRYVYYRVGKDDDWTRLPCTVVGGPFYRNVRLAHWEIQVDGDTKTRFVSGASLVDPTDDATGVRAYQALRRQYLGD